VTPKDDFMAAHNMYPEMATKISVVQFKPKMVGYSCHTNGKKIFISRDALGGRTALRTSMDVRKYDLHNDDDVDYTTQDLLEYAGVPM
jgi:hypothetical protein